ICGPTYKSSDPAASASIAVMNRPRWPPVRSQRARWFFVAMTASPRKQQTPTSQPGSTREVAGASHRLHATQTRAYERPFKHRAGYRANVTVGMKREDPLDGMSGPVRATLIRRRDRRVRSTLAENGHGELVV